MLSQTNRKLAREWHPTKNAPLRPKDVTAGSSRKVWWICDNGHEWETSIHHRCSRGHNCPYCSGQRVCKDNCLRTVNPKLAREWHPTMNAPLTPGDVRPGSRTKVWWLCGKGHEWATPISNRSQGTGCPYCAGTRPSKDNNLQTLNPTMAGEWHPTRNAPLTPKDVTRSCNKKVWWVCGKGHEYEASLNNRSRGEGCPYCVGKKVGKDNSLLTVNPLIAKDWHPTRNLPLTPKDVTAHSSKKIWWLCNKGHESRVAVNDRKGCPFCSGRYATKENCLQSVNPVVAREWHPTKNAPLTPKDVLPKSNKKAWWVCRKGHEWAAPPENRMRGCGCPYCSGKRVTKENCLLTVNPRLAREWHQTKNASLTPRDVTAFAGRHVWWMCNKGHEWKAQINNRSNGRGCPYCSGIKASKENCLETKGPWLAREWHPTKNASWSPKNVAPYSQRQVWWKCKKGHESRESVCSRSQRGGCPVCVLKKKAPRLFERGTCRT